MLTGKSYFRIL